MKKILFSMVFFTIYLSVWTQSKFKSKQDSIATYENQLYKIGKVTFGFKGGYSHTNLYGSERDYIFASNYTSWISAFHGGLIVNTQWGKYFWLKHELFIHQRGAGVTLNDSINGNFNSQLKMLYLDLFPISPTFHIKGFQLYTGPYVSLLADATILRKDENGNEYTDHSIFGTPNNFEDKQKYLQKLDFGIHAGIEYQFPFGLHLGAKYMHGFTDIFQYANSYTLDDTKTDAIKIFNQAFVFSIGYSFVQKGKK